MGSMFGSAFHQRGFWLFFEAKSGHLPFLSNCAIKPEGLTGHIWLPTWTENAVY